MKLSSMLARFLLFAIVSVYYFKRGNAEIGLETPYIISIGITLFLTIVFIIRISEKFLSTSSFLDEEIETNSVAGLILLRMFGSNPVGISILLLCAMGFINPAHPSLNLSIYIGLMALGSLMSRLVRS